MSKQASFSLVAAFSTSPFGGNPAAVVFVDPKNTPEDTLAGIARNVNQPMTAFISPSQLSAENDTIAVYDIRYFAANGVEVSLCGHATLASAKVLFSQKGMASISVLQFHTLTEGVVAAKKVDGGLVEIEFPTGTTTELSEDQKSRVIPMINKAFGREVAINYLGASGPPYEHGEMTTRWIYPVAEFTTQRSSLSWKKKRTLQNVEWMQKDSLVQSCQ